MNKSYHYSIHVYAGNKVWWVLLDRSDVVVFSPQTQLWVNTIKTIVSAPKCNQLKQMLFVRRTHSNVIYHAKKVIQDNS